MATKKDKNFDELIFENREMMKELATIIKTTSIIKENKLVNDTFQHI